MPPLIHHNAAFGIASVDKIDRVAERFVKISARFDKTRVMNAVARAAMTPCAGIDHR